ncbi:hypothetical protein [Petrachloros mirabilis]
MKPVIQLERTGCGIAAAAAIAGVGYMRAKTVAASLGITARDRRLWSGTRHVRRLLAYFSVRVSPAPRPFISWDRLPECALLAVKWYREEGRAYWHWVIYVREEGRPYVLDSRKALKDHVRKDFWRMKPRWYLTVDLVK